MPWKDGLTRNRHTVVYVCLYHDARPNSATIFGQARVPGFALLFGKPQRDESGGDQGDAAPAGEAESFVEHRRGDRGDEYDAEFVDGGDARGVADVQRRK